MSVYVARWGRARAYAWMMRSQPGPYQNTFKADRMWARHGESIRDELVRMKLTKLIPAEETKIEEVDSCNTTTTT